MDLRKRVREQEEEGEFLKRNETIDPDDDFLTPPAESYRKELAGQITEIFYNNNEEPKSPRNWIFPTKNSIIRVCIKLIQGLEKGNTLYKPWVLDTIRFINPNFRFYTEHHCTNKNETYRLVTTPLLSACKAPIPDKDIILALLQRGADIRYQDDRHDRTALHYLFLEEKEEVSREQRKNIAEMLRVMQRLYNPNFTAVDKQGRTAFHYMCKHPKKEYMDFFLSECNQRDVLFLYKDYNGVIPLDVLIRPDDYPHIFEMFKDYVDAIRKKGSFFNTEERWKNIETVALTIVLNKFEYCNYLVTRIPISYQLNENTGRTPLLEAIYQHENDQDDSDKNNKRKFVDLFVLLHQPGPDNPRNINLVEKKTGMNALMLCYDLGHVHLAKRILVDRQNRKINEDVDFNVVYKLKDGREVTLIYFAIKAKAYKHLKELVKYTKITPEQLENYSGMYDGFKKIIDKKEEEEED